MIFVFQDADRTDSLFPQLRSPVNQPSAAHLLQDQKTWLHHQASLLTPSPPLALALPPELSTTGLLQDKSYIISTDVS